MLALLYAVLDSIAYTAVFTMMAAILCTIVVLGIAICLKVANLLLNKKEGKTK